MKQHIFPRLGPITNVPGRKVVLDGEPTIVNACQSQNSGSPTSSRNPAQEAMRRGKVTVL